MNEIIEKEIINIEDMIHEIRGVQVMLSSDVAKLYQVETKVLNQVIKRNINRFPDTFCFQLTSDEIEKLSLRSQFAILNKSNNMRGQHFKYLPYVLTEQGIMMLSGLLKSDIAVKVNIQIIDAFVKMRKYISNSYINNEIILNHESRILNLENTFNKMQESQKVNTIFFNGQIFDAYVLLMDIFENAKEEIIIIDNYAGKELLKILSKIKVKIIIVSKNIDSILISKYTSQYKNVVFKNSDIFHDRFIITDRKKLYHCGASFKDLGKKCFCIAEIYSSKSLNNLLKELP